MTVSDKLLRAGCSAVAALALSAAVMSLFGVASVQISVTTRGDAAAIQREVRRSIENIIAESRQQKQQQRPPSDEQWVI